MSFAAPQPTQTPVANPSASKPHRVLACVLCQTRKIKCDRTFPCSQCLKAGSQCVPATRVPRKRRRRFAERDLLTRLRHYESLLREHNIDFEPLHPDHEASLAKQDTHDDDVDVDEETTNTMSPSVKTETEETYEAKSFWSAMNAGVSLGQYRVKDLHSSIMLQFRDDGEDSEDDADNLQYTAVRKTWDQVHAYSDPMFFGSQNADLDLSPLHPSSIQIIRLFQIYLDNVNPLLKVTHMPTVQGRIIEAAANPVNIDRDLEALMFSFYCMAVTSLTDQECVNMFGSPRKDLLTGYQFACQQALAKCEFLRTSSRDCLTAMFLYLVSLCWWPQYVFAPLTRPQLTAMPFTDPRSLSSMLGVLVRIAQRLGLYSETENNNAGPLDGEIRRRLWWAIVAFDARISEMSNHKEGISLAPTWDCSAPSNVNDSELRPEMKTVPEPQSTPTDSMFAVVRGEIFRYIRRTNFHLDFTNPVLKKLAPHDKLTQKMKSTSISEQESEVDELEQMIESKYLRYCDEENPLHYMTLWYARGYIARCRLIEFYAKCAIKPSDMMTATGNSPQGSSTHPAPTEAQREDSFHNSIFMLECDTKILSSPLTQGYLWLMDHNFPILAYFQVVQHLRRRPLCDQAQRAWDVMDDNFEARFIQHTSPRDESGNPLVHFFAKVVMGAWAAREMAFATQSSSLDPLPPTPKIVKGMRERMAGRNPSPYTSNKTETLATGGMSAPFLMGTADPGMQTAFGGTTDSFGADAMNFDPLMQFGFDTSMGATQDMFDPNNSGWSGWDFSAGYRKG